MDLTGASPITPGGEASSSDDGDSEDMVTITNLAVATNIVIQPQQGTVGGGVAAAGRGELRLHFFDSCPDTFIVYLPFPSDRNGLIDLIVEGLSATCVLPSVRRRPDTIVCKATCSLQDDGSWKYGAVCGGRAKSDENYRRHVLQQHFGGERRGRCHRISARCRYQKMQDGTGSGWRTAKTNGARHRD